MQSTLGQSIEILAATYVKDLCGSYFSGKITSMKAEESDPSK